MAHGGAREGSGRKHKWLDENGNPVETKSVRIPIDISKQELDKAIEIIRSKKSTKDKNN